MEEQFKQFIEDSSRVLITSHVSPDPDAVASVLLLGTTLKLNFPDKKVLMILEEPPARSIDFLESYKDIIFGNLPAKTEEFDPDLFVMVDVANLNRTTRFGGGQLKNYTKNSKTAVAIIDHHEEAGRDDADVYINEHLAATAQQIYQLCFKRLGLQKPSGYEETALLGIITDTNRFKYQNPSHRETFQVVGELLDAGASIEKLETITERYDKSQIEVFVELLKNITDSGKGYNYSYLSDVFVADWEHRNKDFSAIKNGSDLFINQFVRNFEGNSWGFAIYREYLSGKDTYSARFRAIAGLKDVSVLAAKLGGGGHKGAAGAKFEANDLTEAINKVKAVIAQTP